jgi:hypothetical protein
MTILETVCAMTEIAGNTLPDLRAEAWVDDKIVIVAKLVGRCAHCDGVVLPGQRVEKSIYGWMHEDCPADAPDPDPLDQDPEEGAR